MAALPYAKLEPVEGQPDGGCQWLALYDAKGNAVDWPQLRSNKLLIRPVFREFYERADMFNRGSGVYEMPDMLVRGIPGIGKSSFALYCLWRLVMEKHYVLYDYPAAFGVDDTLVFGGGDRKQAVYIADGVAPRRPASIRLLVAAPREEIYEGFRKKARSFFMPEPTAEELSLLRNVCLASGQVLIPDHTFNSRVEHWGRVPGSVFIAGSRRRSGLV